MHGEPARACNPEVRAAVSAHLELLTRRRRRLVSERRDRVRHEDEQWLVLEAGIVLNGQARPVEHTDREVDEPIRDERRCRLAM
jgi:hypothetical protein